MREAGQVCVFRRRQRAPSPEWEGLPVGPPTGVHRRRGLAFCTAIARGLGFGHV